MCVKKFKYIYWVKKRLVLGCFKIEEICDKDNETGLKEVKVTEMSTTMLSILRDAHSAISLFVFTYLIKERSKLSAKDLT